MLELGQPLADLAGVVVVNQRHDAHGLAVVVGDRFFEQRRAHQPTHGLAPVGITMVFAIMIEPVKQLASDGDAETDERSLLGHLSCPRATSVPLK